MIRISLINFLCLFVLHIPAQVQVRFIVAEKYTSKHDSIYITGDFNHWYPKETSFMLQPLNASQKTIVLNLPLGAHEYKFTRGNWENVEKDNACAEIENRSFSVHKDTVIMVEIQGWRDECDEQFLKERLRMQMNDTDKVNTLITLSALTSDINRSRQYAADALSISQQASYRTGQGASYEALGNAYFSMQQYTEARKYYQAAINIHSALGNKVQLANTFGNIAASYYNEENFSEWLQNSYSKIKYMEESGNRLGMAQAYLSIGNFYLAATNEDSAALNNFQLSLGLFEQIHSGYGTWGIAELNHDIGDVYLDIGKYHEALVRDSLALKIFQDLKLNSDIATTLSSIANVFEKLGDQASMSGDKAGSESLIRKAFHISQIAYNMNKRDGNEELLAFNMVDLGRLLMKSGKFSVSKENLDNAIKIFLRNKMNKSALMSAYQALATLDSATGNYKMAYQHYTKYISYRDSLLIQQNTKKAVQYQMQYNFDKKENATKVEQAKKDAETLRTKNRQILVIISFGLIILAATTISFIQLRNNKLKQKANLLLEEQNQKIEKTLSELQSTQAQLIQSEKMASLGELTAGIAHEIQNPLNFVNNFSEVNSELLGELAEELGKGNIASAKELTRSIADNEAKISQHGQRADGIVKGMLQHSRKTTGQKETVELNALADEYLRLAYHGLRSKDNSFNATMKTDFDKSIGKINIIPQDIGRVMLNIYNNAFYAVNEKKKSAEAYYEPTVSVSTKKVDDKITISVKDNGNGIPQKILDKIFQPFFTTKPTGQGTGLGLSLSYDIVKAHGGEILVNSEEGKFTEFIISLPI